MPDFHAETCPTLDRLLRSAAEPHVVGLQGSQVPLLAAAVRRHLTHPFRAVYTAATHAPHQLAYSRGVKFDSAEWANYLTLSGLLVAGHMDEDQRCFLRVSLRPDVDLNGVVTQSDHTTYHQVDYLPSYLRHTTRDGSLRHLAVTARVVGATIWGGTLSDVSCVGEQQFAHTISDILQTADLVHGTDTVYRHWMRLYKALRDPTGSYSAQVAAAGQLPKSSTVVLLRSGLLVPCGMWNDDYTGGTPAVTPSARAWELARAGAYDNV